MQSGAPSVAVLGAGSWGTALALQLTRNGHSVCLWGRDAALMSDVASAGRNVRYLPDVDLPAELRLTSSLREALAATSLLLIATPSHAFAGTLERAIEYMPDSAGLSWACKGFEPGTGRFLHEVAAAMCPPGTAMAVVTGPSFATEVALGLPTAVTVAGNEPGHAERVAALLHGGSFRAYTSTDMIGAELGGAVKNVLAIATGISDGMALGDNARAALITRGLAEMMRLGRALGARPETLTGLAGMGDLVLTCTGNASRNRRLGLALGRGQSVKQALAETGQVVEGVGAAAEVWRLAKAHALSMPISEQVYGILHEGRDPAASLRDLLAREPKPEHGD